MQNKMAFKWQENMLNMHEGYFTAIVSQDTVK